MRITPSTAGQTAHATYPRDAVSLVRRVESVPGWHNLVLADRTLKQRGGGLALTHPQPVVARALSLLGVDQAIEVRDGMSAGADPDR